MAAEMAGISKWPDLVAKQTFEKNIITPIKSP